jgi:putative N6-adenine-specific DNA methylase
MNYVCPCLLGLEGLIAEELRRMGAAGVAAENGRVFFSGDADICARANIGLRCAERVQLVIGQFSAVTFDELFEGTKALPWEEWIGPQDTFPVKGYCLNSQLMAMSACQSIIKKAVAERLTQKYGIAWFEETGAVRQIQFSLMKDRVLLTIDTSGQGLHKRGYRKDAGEAPLKETLAAALCLLSKLRPYHTLYDPMCGSGTILIEGALIACNAAPGIGRPFAAERWEQIPAQVWVRERERAVDFRRVPNGFYAYGSDTDTAALALAEKNAATAGVAELLTFTAADVKDFRMQTERGTLITNPPYGERLGDETEAARLLQTLGKVFPREKGKSYTVISPAEDFEALFGRKADTRRKLYNGMIKCTAFMFYK